MTKLLIAFHNFVNVSKNYYIFILMVNFSINDSLEIWSKFKQFKLTFVWKHPYRVVTNGCAEARISASFSVIVKDTLPQLIMLAFLKALMATSWSWPSGAFLLASTTLPNPPSPKIRTGCKQSIDSLWPLFVWPETQPFA